MADYKFRKKLEDKHFLNSVDKRRGCLTKFLEIY